MAIFSLPYHFFKFQAISSVFFASMAAILVLVSDTTPVFV
jgi:hypothetical protein